MKRLYLFLGCLLGVWLLFHGSFDRAAAAPQQKVIIRLVQEQPVDTRGHSLFKVFLERVNAAAPEKLHINDLGSYEVIPTFEQMEALMRGTVDMLFTAPTFYWGLCPDALAVQVMAGSATVPEVRKSGMVALMDEIHRKKLGVAFLGALWAGEGHMIFSKKPINKADLTGLTVRAVPIQQPTVKSLGGAIKVTGIAEAYTAMERGLVDATVGPPTVLADVAMHEVVKYAILPMLPVDVYVPVTVNAKVWDGLPEDVKKIILDTILELEQEVDAHFGRLVKETLEGFSKQYGVKTIELPPAEAQKFLKISKEASWKELVEAKADPAWLPKLNAIAKPVLGIQ